MSERLNTPILLIAFARPDLTRRVFEAVRQVKPKELYFAVDGPRPGNSRDEARCQEVKDIIKRIDWPCSVKTQFSDKNLGCQLGPYSAMKWFFENVEEGIILEDDVLADESFFYYCQELLEHYRNDKRIGTISGNNFQFGRNQVKESYYFSRYSQTWGWATWRRVWKLYDLKMELWPNVRDDKWLTNILHNRLAETYWRLVFDAVYHGKISSAWDYQWTFMSWVHNLLTIIPNRNLAKNIGIGDADATHTKIKNRFADMKAESISLPLVHPKSIVRNVQADNLIQRQNYVLWKEIAASIIRKLKS